MFYSTSYIFFNNKSVATESLYKDCRAIILDLIGNSVLVSLSTKCIPAFSSASVYLLSILENDPRENGVWKNRD